MLISSQKQRSLQDLKFDISFILYLLWNKKDPLQYHPAFVSAAELELREDRERLEFTEEYKLNSKARMIDFLVIKKKSDERLESGLAQIFKKINIMEYKSKDDALDVSTYLRGMSYAYQYLSETNESNDILSCTLSFVRKDRPEGLMQWLEEHGFKITVFDKGIYHVKKIGQPDMQLVVLGAVDQEKYPWLGVLGDEPERVGLDDVLKRREQLKDARDRECALKLADLIYEKLKKEGKEVGEWGQRMMELEKALEQNRIEIEQRDAQLAHNRAELEHNRTELEQKDALIMELRSQLAAAGL